MQHIDATTLNSLPERLAYSQSFVSFTPADGAAIQASGPLLKPLVQVVLDGIYSKLLSYDITARPFMPSIGHEVDAEADGEPSKPEELTLQHPHIKRQMILLRRYILTIVGTEDWSPQSKLWEYLDKVAVMHTGLPGFKHREKKPELRVEYMHMGLLLGWLADTIIGAVMGMEDLELATRVDVVKAWSKLLWLQNDLFAKYFTPDREIGSVDGK